MNRIHVSSTIPNIVSQDPSPTFGLGERRGEGLLKNILILVHLRGEIRKDKK